jgi:hypothetical protein
MLKRKKTKPYDYVGKSFFLSDGKKKLIRGNKHLVYKIESIDDSNSYSISWMTTKLAKQQTTYTKNHAHQLIHEKSWIIIK